MLQTMSGLGGLAEEAAALLSQAAEETIGGIMANAMSHMAWLKSAGMQTDVLQVRFCARRHQ